MPHRKAVLTPGAELRVGWDEDPPVLTSRKFSLASFPLAAHTTSSDSKQFFSDKWSHVCLPKSMCWNFIALFDGARRWGCWQVMGHEGGPCDGTGALVRETLGPSPSLTSVHREGASLDSDPAGA